MTKSVLSASVGEILTEATKFGNQQVAEVLKYQNAFRVGLEFEYHVAGFYDENKADMTEEYSNTSEAHEYAEEKITKHYGRLINELAEEVTALIKSDIVENYTKVFDFGDTMEHGEGLDDEGYLTDEYQEIFDALTAQEGLLGGFTTGTIENIEQFTKATGEKSLPMFVLAAFDEVLDDSFLDLASYAHDALPEITAARSKLQKNPEGIRRAVAYMMSSHKLSMLFAACDVLKDTGITNTRALVQHVIDSNELDEYKEEKRLEYAKKAISYENREAAINSDSEKAVKHIKEVMDDYPILLSALEENVVDPSVEDGCETITKPLPLRQCIHLLPDFLDFIKEHGITSDNTGLHANISHRFFRTPRLADINLLKMVILLDPDSIQTMAKNERRTGWKERNEMVMRLGNLIDYEIDSLISAYKNGGFKVLEQRLTDKLIRAEKFKSINFTNAFLSSESNQRRVELRFLGGKGYENRQNDIIRDILFGCYTILAAIEPEFLRNDYLKGILRYLDRSTKKKYGKSFLDAVKQ